MSFQHVIIVSSVALAGLGSLGSLGSSMLTNIAGSSEGSDSSAVTMPIASMGNPGLVMGSRAEAAAGTWVRVISDAANAISKVPGEKTIKLPVVKGISGADLKLQIRPTDLSLIGPEGWRKFGNNPGTATALDWHFGEAAARRTTHVSIGMDGDKKVAKLTTWFDSDIDSRTGSGIRHSFYENGFVEDLLADSGHTLARQMRFDATGEFTHGSIRTSHSGEWFTNFDDGNGGEFFVMRAADAQTIPVFKGDHGNFVMDLVSNTEVVNWNRAGTFSGGFELGDTKFSWTAVGADSYLNLKKARAWPPGQEGVLVTGFAPDGRVERFVARKLMSTDGYGSEFTGANGTMGTKGIEIKTDDAGQIVVSHPEADLSFVLSEQALRAAGFNAPHELHATLRNASEVGMEGGAGVGRARLGYFTGGVTKYLTGATPGL